MTIFVTNPHSHPVVLHSFDGHSVHVWAKSRRVPVADKFAWKVPHGVRWEQGPADRVDPSTIIEGTIPEPEILPPKSAEEAMAVEKRFAAAALVVERGRTDAATVTEDDQSGA
jgi:hypothetical protein